MTYTGTDRRVLDPAVRAEVAHYDGQYEVRTGLTGRIGPIPYEVAIRMVTIHNSRNSHEYATDRRATTEPTWTDSWLTADEARAARGNES